jgi:hypothetical protein
MKALLPSRPARILRRRGRKASWSAGRQAQGIDPAMGLYAADAYAQVGRFKNAYSVYT